MDQLVVTPIQHMSTNICSNTTSISLVTDKEKQVAVIEETAKNKDIHDEALKLQRLGKEVEICNDLTPPQCLSVNICSDITSIYLVTVKEEQVDIMEETAKNEDINDEAIKLEGLDEAVENCNDLMSISICSDTISISPVTVKEEQVDIIEETTINEDINDEAIKVETLDEDVENFNGLNPAQHMSISVCSDTTSISTVTVKEEQVAGVEENTRSKIIDEALKFEAFDEDFEIKNHSNITELSPDTGINVNTNSMHFYCDVCNKKTSNKYLLAKHLKVHTKKKPYLCNRCDRTFVKKSHYVTHLRVHTGEKPYSCNRCDKTFSQTSHLATHMRVHTGEKPYSCNRCNKTFTQNSNLLNHIRLHTGEKPYSCNKCDKAFNQKCNLTRHIKRIHTKKKLVALS